ncbi:hypothetical protein ACFX2I_020136 [Malus domestica]
MVIDTLFLYCHRRNNSRNFPNEDEDEKSCIRFKHISLFHMPNFSHSFSGTHKLLNSAMKAAQLKQSG